MKQKEEKLAKEVAIKAVKEAAKEASNASKQLSNDLQLSTKKPKRQQPLIPISLPPLTLHNIEVVAGLSNPALQRLSRTKRTPAYLEGYQL
jgi:hypothetical protein